MRLYLLLALGCAANPEPRVVPELLAHRPVCLALDWGPGPRPIFFGWTAPDTMLLLPEVGEDLGHAGPGGAEGRVGMAASQQERKGGGWIWRTRHDTLVITSLSPTDDILVFAVRPEGRVPATWRGTGFAQNERGQVGLHPYECKGLPAAPENLSFRSYRLEGARPAGFGYSVISDRRIWEQFLRDRTPRASIPSPDTSQIDFRTHSVVILQAASATQCFGEPVVRRVTRQADTVRVLLGSLEGPCQAADYWIEVIELPRVRGPIRVDYPLDEFSPLLWNKREIHIPLDPKDAGFVAAPDSVPSWLLADSSFTGPSRYIGLKFTRNVVGVQFRAEATPAERRSAIELVSGRLIGGYRAKGTYLVRVADPGDGSGIIRAEERLGALDIVASTGPHFGPGD